MKIVYLKKASNEVISHCSCNDGRVTFPSQWDCPWCGCGWLFSCMTCRKAFTFAEGVELETTWEALAREDQTNMWSKEPPTTEISDWVAAMKQGLEYVKVGERYVILDGSIFPAEATNVEFDGWHAHHNFDSLPYTQALDNPPLLNGVLGRRAYWESNALVEKEE